MPENNGKKRSRRVVICGLSLALDIGAFIFCVLVGVKHGALDVMLQFFQIFVLVNTGLSGVAIGALTFTDIFGKFGK